MNKQHKLALREVSITPTNHTVEQAIGNSYAAYEALQAALPSLDITQEWQWYTPHKTWAARGQHKWTTPRGTNKEKTLYWLHVFEGHFTVAVWFKEKNRIEALKADISEKTRELITNASTMGKLPTFPVEFEVTTADCIPDICTLIECKKRLEK